MVSQFKKYIRNSFIIVAAVSMVFASFQYTFAAEDTYGFSRVTGNNFRDLVGVASAGDGMRQAVAFYDGYIQTSTDGGVTWTEQIGSGPRKWQAIAYSADGSRIIAGTYGQYMYSSTDGGTTWTELTGAGMNYWWSIAMSADGMKVFAATDDGGPSFTSTDGGATWTERGATGPVWGDGSDDYVASSADGTRLYAAQSWGYVYTSSDSGATWTAQTSTGQQEWGAISASSDGSKLVAVTSAGGIYTSTDYGANWTLRGTNIGSGYTLSAQSSADGVNLVVASYGNSIHTSSDSGVTWTQRASAGTEDWQGIAASSNGQRIVAITAEVPVGSVQVRVSSDGGATWATSINREAFWSGTVTAGSNERVLAGRGNSVYLSTDGGRTFGSTPVLVGGANGWDLAASADGTKLVATNWGGYIHTSTDFGATWTQVTGAGLRYWSEVTASADGTHMAASVYCFGTCGASAGVIYTSSDSGATWVQQAGSLNPGWWHGIDSSADGSKLVAVTDRTSTGSIYTSTDYGVTWTQRFTGSGGAFYGVTSSSDGTKLAAVRYDANNGGYVYTSTDSGATWTTHTDPGRRWWMDIYSSDDGMKLLALPQDGTIHTSVDGGATWVEHAYAGFRTWNQGYLSPDGNLMLATNGYASLYRAVLGVSTGVDGQDDSSASDGGSPSGPGSAPGEPSLSNTGMNIATIQFVAAAVLLLSIAGLITHRLAGRRL